MNEAAGQNDFYTALAERDFDVVQYLNHTLPTFSISSQPSSVKQNRLSQLHSGLAETQSFLSRLNTQNVRKSTELSIITDEILRSGSRLAYEVEVLRGDAASLCDLLSDTLQDEIQNFVTNEFNTADGRKDADGGLDPVPGASRSVTDPDFMQQLQLFGLVKARLEKVIAIFGEALKWPIPPSDVSVTSSLISVSAPELGVANSVEDDQARAINKQYRAEMIELLQSGHTSRAGLEAAEQRLEQWRNLSQLWRGTIEEKARARVVDGFEKVVEERRRTFQQSQQRRPDNNTTARGAANPGRMNTPGLSSGGSFFGGLRKLRDEIYLE